MSGSDSSQAQLSLLHLQVSEKSTSILLSAAKRIARNIRQSDAVLLKERQCAVVLPGTSLLGAEAVVKRLTPLLVDIEYELQMVFGRAANTLIQRLQSEQAIVVRKEVELSADMLVNVPKSVEQQSKEKLPYLAFLSNFPHRRLLQLFPYELACRYQCVPVGAEGGILTLASSQLLNADVLSQIRTVTQRSIFQVRCEAGMVDDVLRYWEHVAPVQICDYQATSAKR